MHTFGALTFALDPLDWISGKRVLEYLHWDTKMTFFQMGLFMNLWQRPKRF